MKLASALALAGLVLLAATDKGEARIHAQMYCWELDSEFPVPCEEDYGDDEVSRGGFGLQEHRRTLSLKPDPWNLSGGQLAGVGWA